MDLGPEIEPHRDFSMYRMQGNEAGECRCGKDDKYGLQKGMSLEIAQKYLTLTTVGIYSTTTNIRVVLYHFALREAAASCCLVKDEIRSMYARGDKIGLRNTTRAYLPH